MAKWWVVWRRSRFCGVFLIIALFQVVIFYFLSKTEVNGNGQNALEIFRRYKGLVLRLNGASTFDATGKFKVYPLSLAETKDSAFDVTLVSQCSSNHIHYIPNLIDVWKGPISVAVFEEGKNIENTLWNLAKMLHCQRDTKSLMLLLVLPALSVYTTDFNYGSNMVQHGNGFETCEFYPENASARNYARKLSYPVNLLRNVAKLQSTTDYIFVLDIDMTPSRNLRDYFLAYMTSSGAAKDRIVYVVPAFEVDERHQNPDTKERLKELVAANVCRPFYAEPCPDCQGKTHYTKWMQANTTGGTRSLYEVKWRHPWEPFFIGRSDLPNFDERFQQYGMNRVSQVCELHVAGYRFHVLDNAFLIHRGFKRRGEFHASKNSEMKRNRVLYGRFKEELRYRYPNSREKC